MAFSPLAASAALICPLTYAGDDMTAVAAAPEEELTRPAVEVDEALMEGVDRSCKLVNGGSLSCGTGCD